MGKDIQGLMHRMATMPIERSPREASVDETPVVAERSRGPVRLVRPRLGSQSGGASSLTERVADLLSKHGPVGSDELARRLSIEPARIQLELQELEALGLVVRSPAGWHLG